VPKTWPTVRSANQEGKTNLGLLEQEIPSGSGISWAICKSVPWPRHITKPVSHHSVFYRLDVLPAIQPTAVYSGPKFWSPGPRRRGDIFGGGEWNFFIPFYGSMCQGNSGIKLGQPKWETSTLQHWIGWLDFKDGRPIQSINSTFANSFDSTRLQRQTIDSIDLFQGLFAASMHCDVDFSDWCIIIPKSFSLSPALLVVQNNLTTGFLA